MTWHVVMPFSRPQHAAIYARLLRGQGLVWHPLFSDPVSGSALMAVAKHWGWIRPVGMALPPDQVNLDTGEYSKVNPCYWKLNEFARTQKLEDSDHYTFLTDDNLWCYYHWARLQQYKGPVVVCAERRPHAIINPCPEAMRCCIFDLNMLTLRGDIYKTARFEEDLWCADGLLAEQLAAQFEGRIDFVPTAMIYHNMLTPADWGYPHNTVTG